MREEQKIGAGGISIHAVDVARGIPASGLSVRLWRLDGIRVDIASGICSESGLFEHPVTTGVGVERGMYEVEFDISNLLPSKRHRDTRPCLPRGSHFPLWN